MIFDDMGENNEKMLNKRQFFFFLLILFPQKFINFHLKSCIFTNSANKTLKIRIMHIYIYMIRISRDLKQFVLINMKTEKLFWFLVYSYIYIYIFVLAVPENEWRGSRGNGLSAPTKSNHQWRRVMFSFPYKF